MIHFIFVNQLMLLYQAMDQIFMLLMDIVIHVLLNLIPMEDL
jgi:hypothetical protein